MNNIQAGFVNIRTLFNNANERTVENLQKLYEDHAFMMSVVEELTDTTFAGNTLKDKRILLKPNWVKHFFREYDLLCLCTHHNFLLAVLETVLLKKPAAVVIGDAPIQGCRWQRLITDEFVSKVNVLSVKHSIPVEIKDFRRVVFDTVTNEVESERKPMDEYIIFDTGEKSYLEPVTLPGKNLFRVSQYNSDKFIATHKPGMHKYCLTKELFNADVIISLPKIKTHEKTGITCALKNIVGLNGDKDFLPHHRIGGTAVGGDSYPGKNLLRYWAELALDNANRQKGKKGYWFWRRLSIVFWKISMPGKHHQQNAAWYGNDTTWRMVMDLNMIINYGKADGTLAKEPQRFLYSICDGIIGGQGDGPLKPDPLNLGVVCFSNDSATTDLCMATLMGLAVEKLPLLNAAKAFMPGRHTSIMLNGKTAKIKELEKYAVKAALPPGWRN